MRTKYIVKIMQDYILQLGAYIKKHETQKTDCSIHIRKVKGKQYFYQYNTVTGKDKYIPRKNAKLIKELAQGMYVRNATKYAQKEIEALRQCVEILKDSNLIDKAYEELPKILKTLVDPNAPDDEFVKEWQNQKFIRNIDPPGEENKTERGEYVRSRIELIIANALFRRGIPYHYEKPFEISMFEDDLYPDFTILNKRTGKVYLWEHMGRMDDEKYRIRNLKKIETYAKKGYLLGKDLIVTFEGGGKSLSTWMIDKIIDAYFV